MSDNLILKYTESISLENYTIAINFIMKNGMPSYISFSSDVEDVINAIEFTNQLIEMDINSGYRLLKNFEYDFNCKCLVKKNMVEASLNNYLNFKICPKCKNEEFEEVL